MKIFLVTLGCAISIVVSGFFANTAQAGGVVVPSMVRLPGDDYPIPYCQRYGLPCD